MTLCGLVRRTSITTTTVSSCNTAVRGGTMGLLHPRNTARSHHIPASTSLHTNHSSQLELNTFPPGSTNLDRSPPSAATRTPPTAGAGASAPTFNYSPSDNSSSSSASLARTSAGIGSGSRSAIPPVEPDSNLRFSGLLPSFLSPGFSPNPQIYPK